MEKTEDTKGETRVLRILHTNKTRGKDIGPSFSASVQPLRQEVSRCCGHVKTPHKDWT